MPVDLIWQALKNLEARSEWACNYARNLQIIVPAKWIASAQLFCPNITECLMHDLKYKECCITTTWNAMRTQLCQLRCSLMVACAVILLAHGSTAASFGDLLASSSCTVSSLKAYVCNIQNSTLLLTDRETIVLQKDILVNSNYNAILRLDNFAVSVPFGEFAGSLRFNSRNFWNSVLR